MSRTYVDIQDAMYRSLVCFFDRKIKNVKYNYTREGFITEVLGDNQYTVKINGFNSSINGTSMPTSQYFVGDVVLIEVVNNDFSFKYIKCLRPY
ncbi:hypothetical protein [Clostridium sp. CF012]|uniref:hypothetical protein n=1 Tax=Clostridium sp. CF012 TaxID=2843319 RepID=UPI001C0DF6F4|nr:hypothetical protein [Clostridium sp. CF012]MBU3142223.1 hypothetical protein [Clostridium sp. CF012]